MNHETIVILEDIRSAFNVGSAFRTCDGAGVSKLYLCGITPDGNHVKIKKTALGADEYLDWEYRKDIVVLLEELKEKGFKIYSIEQSDKSVDFKSIDYPQKVVFIFGNEITGVSTQTMESSDRIIDIPMKGKKNSLNVATCIGIILYNLPN